MGRIYLTHFYTTFVEHCLQVVVGHKPSMGLPKKWISFSEEWILKLSISDQQLIFRAFDSLYNYSTTTDRALKISDVETYDMNRERLFKLERDFAIKGGLIGSCSDEE